MQVNDEKSGSGKYSPRAIGAKGFGYRDIPYNPPPDCDFFDEEFTAFSEKKNGSR